MKATIYDPVLGTYVVEVPGGDPALLKEIEEFTKENTRLIKNADRKEGYHVQYHMEAMESKGYYLGHHVTPERILLRKEQTAEYQMALAQLTPVQLHRFEMCVEGLSYREIADIENSNFTSIAESISAARKKLKKVL